MWKVIPLALLQSLLLCSGQVMLKLALARMHILKNYPFGVAYPLTSMSYLFGVFAALLVFHEQVTASQWVGVLLIMAGCALIVK